jgi:hypothetical protein
MGVSRESRLLGFSSGELETGTGGEGKEQESSKLQGLSPASLVLLLGFLVSGSTYNCSECGLGYG